MSSIYPVIEVFEPDGIRHERVAGLPELRESLASPPGKIFSGSERTLLAKGNTPQLRSARV
ncbi:MAG TPA: hypothetical protein VMD78_11775 [Candidatus Baltobacteraceae bacterium]|nr:hypothetical protein [Candidatus Baltobacteraceae bacterium]